MTETEKVEILLKEYDTLREEILQRANQRFQFLAISGAIGAVGFFTTSPFSPFQSVAIIVSAVAVVCVWWRLGQIIAECARRVAEIERRVNKLVGEELLDWERSHVGRSLFHRLHSPANKRQQPPA